MPVGVLRHVFNEGTRVGHQVQVTSSFRIIPNILPLEQNTSYIKPVE